MSEKNFFERKGPFALKELFNTKSIDSNPKFTDVKILSRAKKI